MKFSQIREEIDKMEQDKHIPCFKPDWPDLENIYNLVIEHKPMRVVEFGFGYSTYVIWAALHSLGRGQLCALESEPLYYINNSANLQGLLSKNRVKDYGVWPEQNALTVTIAFSPLRNSSRHGVKFSYVPLNEPDFVYVDGPPSSMDKFICDNLYDFHPAPKVILIDSRADQTILTQTIFGDQYHATKIKEPWFSLFVKKETLAEFIEKTGFPCHQ